MRATPVLAALVLAAALLCLAAYFAYLSYRELEEAAGVPLLERVGYWLRSAAHLLVFTVLALLALLAACLAYLWHLAEGYYRSNWP